MTFTDSRVCCAVRADRMWWEAFERVSLGQHKSFYPHRTQFTAVEQIIEVGDIWNYSLSALESYHACNFPLHAYVCVLDVCLMCACFMRHALTPRPPVRQRWDASPTALGASGSRSTRARPRHRPTRQAYGLRARRARCKRPSTSTRPRWRRRWPRDWSPPSTSTRTKRCRFRCAVGRGSS